MTEEFLRYKDLIDQFLEKDVAAALPKERLGEAMSYSILAPGKRLRGVLTLAFGERLGLPIEHALPFAAALEMIHAYSLVHDDMPEMDNDDLRRGMPTCHKKFDQATALLAGDAILNFSVEFLLKYRKLYQPTDFLDAMDVLYSAAGANGMLRGQILDIMSENRMISLDELCLLHQCKTGALLLAPILMMQKLAHNDYENYVNYSKHIGLAFQIKDDLLDIEGNADILGKDIGKDAVENKSTFPSIMGIKKAHEYLAAEIAAAKQSVKEDLFLIQLADYIESRSK